jgi:hypothetical protein
VVRRLPGESDYSRACKWQKIERRLSAHISMSWRGRPLTSHEVIVESIATTTRSGLTVRAELDTTTYPAGVRTSDQQMKDLEAQRTLARHTFRGRVDCTLNPKTTVIPDRPNVELAANLPSDQTAKR